MNTRLSVVMSAGLLALSLASTMAVAGKNRHENDVRDFADQSLEEIQAGIFSGELTRKETRKLVAEQVELNQMQLRFWRDGRISHREKRELKTARKALSEHITRLRGNHRHNDLWAGDTTHRNWYYSYRYRW